MAVLQFYFHLTNNQHFQGTVVFEQHEPFAFRELQLARLHESMAYCVSNCFSIIYESRERGTVKLILPSKAFQHHPE